MKERNNLGRQYSNEPNFGNQYPNTQYKGYSEEEGAPYGNSSNQHQVNTSNQYGYTSQYRGNVQDHNEDRYGTSTQYRMQTQGMQNQGQTQGMQAQSMRGMQGSQYQGTSQYQPESRSQYHGSQSAQNQSYGQGTNQYSGSQYHGMNQQNQYGTTQYQGNQTQGTTQYTADSQYHNTYPYRSGSHREYGYESPYLTSHQYHEESEFQNLTGNTYQTNQGGRTNGQGYANQGTQTMSGQQGMQSMGQGQKGQQGSQTMGQGQQSQTMQSMTQGQQNQQMQSMGQRQQGQQGQQSTTMTTQSQSQQQKGPQYNDRDRVNDLLASEKYLTEGYNVSTFEATNPELHNTLKNILNETHTNRETLHREMEQRGWYKTEQADQQQIMQAQNQFNNYKDQLPF